MGTSKKILLLQAIPQDLQLNPPPTPVEFFYLTTFPIVGILPFRPPGLGSNLIRGTVSYSYEGREAVALFDPL